jgi:hypothetical protein
VSLREIRLSGEDGGGMAATGLVPGVAGTAFFVLVVAFAALIIDSVVSSATFPWERR